MTNPTTSAAIRAELADNAHALRLAREDFALYERLKAAKATAEQLAKRGQELTDMLPRAIEAEAKAAQDALFAGLADLSITETPADKSSSVLSSVFKIAYTRDAWNADFNKTMRQPVTMTGFASLPSNVYAWIVERHPEKLPASIMALAPNDPKGALQRYFVGLRRGYLAN